MKLPRACLGLAVLCVSCSAGAATVAFTNEAEFMAALDAQGYVHVLEGFEDDEVWGTVRSPSTAPARTNFSVRFSPNTGSSGITTSQGPPRTGQWGVYSDPHGSYASGTNCDIPGNCGDGLRISSEQPMRGFSAWVKGSFGGKLEVILNGDRLNPVNFPDVCDPLGENCVNYGLLSAEHKFFGVLDSDGFTNCELREVEGTAEDQKFIWCDDFLIAFANAPPPFIRNVSVSDAAVSFHFKGLAIRGHYALERSLSLASNDWSVADTFTASTTETNLTRTNSPGPPRSFFRLRSP